MRKNSIVKRYIYIALVTAVLAVLAAMPVFAEAAMLPVTASGGTNPDAAADGDADTCWEGKVKSKLLLDFGGIKKISRIEIDWAVDEDDTTGFYKLNYTLNKVNFQEIADRASCFNEERTPSFTAADENTKTSIDNFKQPIHMAQLQLEILLTSPENKEVRIREVRVYGSDADGEENVALNKPVTFTGGLQNSDAAQKNPAIFNDGSFYTGICGTDNATRFGVPYGLIIDLGEVCKISDIYCRFPDKQTTRNYYSYTLSGSIDGTNQTFSVSDTKDDRTYMMHNFLSKMSGNPYWQNGFYFTQNSFDEAYARYINLEVTGFSYQYAYGLNEIVVMGKSEKKASVLGKIGLNAKLTDADGSEITSFDGTNVNRAEISVTNNSDTDISVKAAVEIYRNGILSEVIKSDAPVTVAANGTGGYEIAVDREIGENDTVTVLLTEDGGNEPPLCEKLYFWKKPQVVSSTAERINDVFSAGYTEDNVSVEVNAGEELGERTAAIVLKNTDGNCIAYETVNLDADGKGRVDFKIDADSGEYTLELLVQGIGAGYGKNTAIFKYTNTLYFKKSRTALYNAATSEEMHKVLTDTQNIKNLSIGDAAEIYTQIGSEQTDKMLIEYLASNPFESFDSDDAFKTALSEKIKEFSLVSALSGGNGIKVFSDYEDVLDAIFPFKEISAYKNYYKRYDDGTKKVICERLSGKSFEDKDDFKNKLISAIFLGAIENIDNWTEIKNIINNNTDFFGANNAKLKNVSDVSKVYKGICKKAYNSAEEVRRDESRLIDENLIKKTTSGGGGSGGSSSSSGKTVVSVPHITDNTDKSETVQETGFADMSGYEWAKIPAQVLLKEGIVNGTGDNEFSPSAAVKREEFVKMLCLLFKVKSDGTDGTFSDIPKSHWCSEYVSAAQKYGLVMGIGDNKFGFGASITREEMAAMCFRFASAYGTELSGEDDLAEGRFIDDGDISEYAYEAVYRMKSAGIISGNDEEEFAPKDTAVRAEAAKIIYNIFIFNKSFGGEIK